MDNVVRINVGGKIFITTYPTLRRFPMSRLAKMRPEDTNYDPAEDAYFFDRSPKAFACVIDAFRTGHVHIPHCFCGPSIRDELEFWGLNETYIADCCWAPYKRHDEDVKTLKTIDQTLQESRPKNPHVPDGAGWFRRMRSRLWQFLEYPKSSVPAKIWQVIMVIVVVISVLISVVSTVPELRVVKTDMTNTTRSNATNPKLALIEDTQPHPALLYTDLICFTISTLELLLRFISCPSRLKFFTSPFNVIEIACVLPALTITLTTLTVSRMYYGLNYLVLLGFMSVSSVLRVVRLLKLITNYRGFQILYLAIKASARQLLLLALLILMVLLTFSTAIYFAEFYNEKLFLNVPSCFWWSIITMTTVGYGDVVPTTWSGYLFGSLCAISGMLVAGLPIPIIASNFNYYYSRDALNRKLKGRYRQRPSGPYFKNRYSLAEIFPLNQMFSCCSKPSVTFVQNLSVPALDRMGSSVSGVGLQTFN